MIGLKLRIRFIFAKKITFTLYEALIFVVADPAVVTDASNQQVPSPGRVWIPPDAVLFAEHL